SRAQVASAQAQLDAAKREYERSRQLFEKSYISAAALERAEAQFKSATAQAQVLLQQAAAAGTQTQFYFLRAPYAGVVATVDMQQGDMAMPGKQVLSLYDPERMRVVLHLPESVAGQLRPDSPVQIEIPSAPEPARLQASNRIQVLPVADPGTHTVEVRV